MNFIMLQLHFVENIEFYYMNNKCKITKIFYYSTRYVIYWRHFIAITYKVMYDSQNIYSLLQKSYELSIKWFSIMFIEF